MKKRILSLILVFSIILGISSIAFGENIVSPSIMVNNKTISLDRESFKDEKGTLMVPLRSLFEQLNYKVKWNEDMSINLNKENQSALLQIDKQDLNINGKIEKMQYSPIIKEKKTFVPVELIDKTLNSVLAWNSKKEVLGLRDIKVNEEKIFVMTEDQEKIEELDKYMEALVKYENFHGSVLVAKEGKVLLNNGYGYADFAQNIENKSQTRFGIGSVTKQFAALAALKLSREGLLDLEEKVMKYIPDFPHGDKISIHNLLTHTSGLKNYTDLPEFWTSDTANKDPNKMLDLIRDMELEFIPGETFHYSNTNYLAMGIIIEKISGETFEDYLESITKPLGMKDTGMIYGENKGTKDATTYSGYLEVKEIDDDLVTSQAYAAGSMYSTVEDLYRWDRAIANNELLEKELLDEMFKAHIAIPEAGSYGYGWMMEDTDMGKEIFHGGSTIGFTAYIGRLVSQDLTVIILSNNNAYNVNSLKEDLTSIVLNKKYKMPEEIKEIKIEDEELYSKYSGKYNLTTGLQIDIFEKDEKLYAQGTGQEAFELFPKSNTDFFAKTADINIMFKTNEEGIAREFILLQSGMEFVGNRVEKEDKVEIKLDPKVYDDYVGEYKLAENMIITILKEEDKLFAELTGQPKAEIFPSSETEFFYKVVDAEIIFEKDAEGNVTNLLLNQMGQSLPANKVK